MSSPLFCSKSCKEGMNVRSFGECPECQQRWDQHDYERQCWYRPRAPDRASHFRNDFERLANHPTAAERVEELDAGARNILGRLDSGESDPG